jgi:WD40 repeat protein
VVSSPTLELMLNICEKEQLSRGHADVVCAVAWSPDGQRIASGSSDQTVQVWQAV